VDQGSSWETDSSSAGHEVFYFCLEPPCLQETATGLYPEAGESSLHIHSQFSINFNTVT
jgi:hypothetical protein